MPAGACEPLCACEKSRSIIVCPMNAVDLDGHLQRGNPGILPAFRLSWFLSRRILSGKDGHPGAVGARGQVGEPGPSGQPGADGFPGYTEKGDRGEDVRRLIFVVLCKFPTFRAIQDSRENRADLATWATADHLASRACQDSTSRAHQVYFFDDESIFFCFAIK